MKQQVEVTLKLSLWLDAAMDEDAIVTHVRSSLPNAFGEDLTAIQNPVDVLDVKQEAEIYGNAPAATSTPGMGCGMNIVAIKLTTPEAIRAACELSIAQGEQQAQVMYKSEHFEDDDYVGADLEEFAQVKDDPAEFIEFCGGGRHSWELWVSEATQPAKETDDGSIAIVWNVEDVLEVRPDLTAEQAKEVLRRVKRCHDANVGINWVVLDVVAGELFPETASTSESGEAA